MNYSQFTSESVCSGHPDKICDRISDSILDAALSIYPKSRVAVETMVTRDHVFIAGEVTSPKKIIQAVAEFYDLKESELLTASRKKEIVRPRQIVMYLLREELGASFPFIGRKMGGKDHTTVMHAYKKISFETKNNEGFQEEINLLKQKIYNS